MLYSIDSFGWGFAVIGGILIIIWLVKSIVKGFPWEKKD